MHKDVGWMLREVGKRVNRPRGFLGRFGAELPARPPAMIERFQEARAEVSRHGEPKGNEDRPRGLRIVFSC
jgi:3-methyladenine DNA glycosylase AlkD